MADTTRPIDPGSARVTIFDPDTMTEPMEAIVRIGSLSIPSRFDPDGAAKLAYDRRGLTFIPSDPNPAMTVQALPTLDTFIHNPSGLDAFRNIEDADTEMGGTHGRALAPADWPKIRDVSRQSFDESFGPIALDPKAARELLEVGVTGPATGALTVGPGDTDYDALRQAIEHCMNGGAQRLVLGMSSPGGPAIDLFSACDRIRATADYSDTGSIGVHAPMQYSILKLAREPKIFLHSIVGESGRQRIETWARTTPGQWIKVRHESSTRRAHPRSLSRVKRQRRKVKRHGNA